LGGIPYVNLEDPAEREFASNDPRGFLAPLHGHGVIDEIQYAPDLLSYIQIDVDENPGTGRYMLTGSNQPDFYSAYLMTYLERDVRNSTRTQNLAQFQKFMELCADRF